MNTVIRYGLYGAVVYGLLVLAVFILQRRMLYFPDQRRPAAQALPAMGLRFWPGDGEAYRGLVDARPSDTFHGTVIAFHGNAGSARDRLYFRSALHPLGYRVILAEYPGYAGRPGKINQTVLVRDAVETINQARAEFGAPVYVLGESLGCAVAAAATAAAPVPPDGLILITPWASLPDLAQSLYWYLPARLLTLDRFDSVGNLRAYDGPVAMAMALKDEVIPNKHTMKLFNALTAPKRLWQFRGAGHNSWPTGADEPWWREAMEFVASNRPKVTGRQSRTTSR